ncbi:TonB-dependent receptor [bacterium]|nr:TonB-dependent receptor [bacterium]UNM07412.1 MAG: TonB-dependent receptor [Planctomycetales bacterium]
MRCLLLILLLLACLPVLPCRAEDGDAVEIDLDHLYDDYDPAFDISIDDSDDDLTVDLGSSLVSDNRSLAMRLGDWSALSIIDRNRFTAHASLADILESIAGADVRRLGGNGQLSTLSLRGASAGQVLVLLDGQPVSPLQATDLSSLGTTSLDRIEVLRGPQALQFGPGALGGVVNLVSISEDRQESFPAYAESGLPFKEYFADLADFEFRERTENPPVTRYAVLAGSNDYYEMEISRSDASLSWSYGMLSAENDYSYKRADGTTARRANADVLRHELLGSWQVDETDWRFGFSDMSRGIPGSAEFPTLSARMDRQSLWLQATRADYRTALSAQFSQVRDPHPYLNRGEIDNRDLLLHLEHEHRNSDSLLRPRLDFADGDSAARKLHAGIDYSAWQEKDQGNWKFQYSWGLTASSDVGIDPMAGIALRRDYGNSASLRASMTRAVRHPSFDELYLGDSGSVRGNPDLKPETVDNIEIGYGRRYGSARLDCAAFYSLYRDSIIFAPVSAYLVEARNTGQASIAGMEGSLDWRLASDLWWTSSATWLPVAEYRNGTPLTGRSSLHAGSGLQYRQDSFSAAASLDYTSSIPADLFGNLRTSPRSIVNLEFSIGPDPAGWQLGISNLFNGSARDAWNYPLPGREISVSWSESL